MNLLLVPSSDVGHSPRLRYYRALLVLGEKARLPVEEKGLRANRVAAIIP